MTTRVVHSANSTPLLTNLSQTHKTLLQLLLQPRQFCWQEKRFSNFMGKKKSEADVKLGHPPICLLQFYRGDQGMINPPHSSQEQQIGEVIPGLKNELQLNDVSNQCPCLLSLLVFSSLCWKHHPSQEKEWQIPVGWEGKRTPAACRSHELEASRPSMVTQHLPQPQELQDQPATDSSSQHTAELEAHLSSWWFDFLWNVFPGHWPVNCRQIINSRYAPESDPFLSVTRQPPPALLSSANTFPSLPTANLGMESVCSSEGKRQGRAYWSWMAFYKH